MPRRLERVFVQEIDGGKPLPLTPESVEPKLPFRVSPGGDKFICIDTNEMAVLYFVDGSPPKPIPGLPAQDSVAGWCADDESVFVRVYKLEVAGNNKGRDPVIELLPMDIAGITDSRTVFVAPDGRSCFYQVSRRDSDLFAAAGLK